MPKKTMSRIRWDSTLMARLIVRESKEGGGGHFAGKLRECLLSNRVSQPRRDSTASNHHSLGTFWLETKWKCRAFPPLLKWTLRVSKLDLWKQICLYPGNKFYGCRKQNQSFWGREEEEEGLFFFEKKKLGRFRLKCSTKSPSFEQRLWRAITLTRRLKLANNWLLAPR